jgi:hypothetical protein
LSIHRLGEVQSASVLQVAGVHTPRVTGLRSTLDSKVLLQLHTEPLAQSASVVHA